MSILNKRAVSPVVAAILLIGLVVTAAAMLSLVILPMINNDKLDSNSMLTDLNGLQLTVSNGHVFDVTMVNITIDGTDYFFNTVIGVGKASIFILAIEPVNSLSLTITGKGQTITVTVAV